jgi:excisionase family DNA binding protein
MPEILTVKEVASYLRVGPKTVYLLIAEGKLGHFRVRRAIRIPRKSLQEYLEVYGGAEGSDAMVPSSSCKSA